MLCARAWIEAGTSVFTHLWPLQAGNRSTQTVLMFKDPRFPSAGPLFPGQRGALFVPAVASSASATLGSCRSCLTPPGYLTASERGYLASMKLLFLQALKEPEWHNVLVLDDDVALPCNFRAVGPANPNLGTAARVPPLMPSGCSGSGIGTGAA
jgi:hypothetical protein